MFMGKQWKDKRVWAQTDLWLKNKTKNEWIPTHYVHIKKHNWYGFRKFQKSKVFNI